MTDKEPVEVSNEEALRMEIVLNQALTNLLVEKGIITEAVLMEKVKALKQEMRDSR